MRSDARLGIGWALGVVDIPQPGNPTRAEQIVELLDFFGVFHFESLREKLFFTTKHTNWEINRPSFVSFGISFENVI